MKSTQVFVHEAPGGHLTSAELLLLLFRHPANMFFQRGFKAMNTILQCINSDLCIFQPIVFHSIYMHSVHIMQHFSSQYQGNNQGIMGFSVFTHSLTHSQTDRQELNCIYQRFDHMIKFEKFSSPPATRPMD